MVIGSQVPWVEVMLLEFGAELVTTLEYNPVVTDHPKLRVVTPEELNEMVRAQTSPVYLVTSA